MVQASSVQSNDIIKYIVIGILVVFVVVYFVHQTNKWKNESASIQWPPMINNCPDYWIDKGNGVCLNAHNLGKQHSVDFKDVGGHNIYMTKDPIQMQNQLNTPRVLRSKCRWAKKHKVSWEGVNGLCD